MNIPVIQIIQYQGHCPICSYRGGMYSTPEFARLSMENHVKASHESVGRARELFN